MVNLEGSSQLPTILPHRIAAHLDPMGVVHEPVEDSIGQRRIADLFVPAVEPHGEQFFNQQLCPLIKY